MQQAAAFAPGHITGFFYLPRELKDRLSSLAKEDLDLSFSGLMELAERYASLGSIGAGFSLDLGMSCEAKVESSKEGDEAIPEEPAIRCFYNGNEHSLDELKVTAFVTRALLGAHREAGGSAPGEVELIMKSPLPLKAGFGLSAAAALSSSFALARALGLRMEEGKMVMLSHLADCWCKGGLGDVVGAWGGGFEQRIRPGIPPVGKLLGLPFDEKEANLLFLVLEKELETADVLSNPGKMNQIQVAGSGAETAFREEPTLENFVSVSYRFSQEAGLIPPGSKGLLQELNAIPGCQASPAHLGNTLMVLGDLVRARPLLEGRGQLIEAGLSSLGVRYI